MIEDASTLVLTRLQNAPANKKNTNAAESQEANAPPTPTPPPPMTPNNAASFNKNGQMQNGQPTPAQQNANSQPPSAPQVQQMPDMNAGPFGALQDDQFSNLDFANLDSGDVLDNFDFDSFLNNTGDNDGLAFDANFAFGDAGADPLDMHN